MKFAYLKPEEKISDYVREILVMENERAGEPFVMPLFPNGMPTLLFHTAKGIINNNSNYLTLFGQTVSPATLTINGKFILIAYFLQPHALVSLFGISPKELTNNPMGMNLVASCKTAAVEEQLLNADSSDVMIELINNYLFNLVVKTKVDTRLITYATNTIVQRPFGKILNDVQNELCVTERSFQRMFEQQVGVAPGLFRRICQFNNAFQQLNRNRSEKLSDVTFRHGYADQSHFIRVFKEFTQVTPTDYLNFGSTSV